MAGDGYPAVAAAPAQALVLAVAAMLVLVLALVLALMVAVALDMPSLVLAVAVRCRCGQALPKLRARPPMLRLQDFRERAPVVEAFWAWAAPMAQAQIQLGFRTKTC